MGTSGTRRHSYIEFLKNLPLTYLFAICYVVVNILVYALNGYSYPSEDSARRFTLLTSWFNWSENYDTTTYPNFLSGFVQNFTFPLLFILEYETYTHYFLPGELSYYASAVNSFVLGAFSSYILSWESYVNPQSFVDSGSSILGFCMLVTFILMVLLVTIIKGIAVLVFGHNMKEFKKTVTRVFILLALNSIALSLYLGKPIHIAGLEVYLWLFLLSIPSIFTFNKIKSQISRRN